MEHYCTGAHMGAYNKHNIARLEYMSPNLQPQSGQPILQIMPDKT